jgi:2-C-methyl-D-erythritol 4-phosphate cytidylyltransferase
MDATPHRPSSCCAILVAAGSSRRMGMDKLLWPLLGVPVLLRSIEAFAAADCIDSLIVVCPADRWLALDPPAFAKPLIRVDGGAERQDSVAEGLAAIPAGTQLVAIHDAARPLVHPDDIDRCVAAARSTGAATLARRVVETVKRSDALDFCLESVSREHLWAMETPQVFAVEALKDACAAVASRKLTVTDEVSAAQAVGLKIKFIESRHPNLKITSPADLALAEALLTCRNRS